MTTDLPPRSPRRRRDVGGLAGSMRSLSSELAALSQELRCLRDAVGDLRTQVDKLRQDAAAKDEQVIVLRTQHRVLWAVAGAAGSTAVGALVLAVIRLVNGA